MKNLINVLSLLALVLTLSCENKQEATNQNSNEAKALVYSPKRLEQASSRLQADAETALKTISEEYKKLETSIKHFLETPNKETKIAVQANWIAFAITKRKYFYPAQLTLAAPTQFEPRGNLYYQISAFPILPGFIDSFGEYTFSGLVNDISLPINRESIINQHGATDTEEVILGIYAMEYLLFGEALTRKHEDFFQIDHISDEQKELGLTSTLEIPNNRRRKLLLLQLEILSENLKSLTTQWSSKETALRGWKKLDEANQVELAKQSLKNAITQLLIEIVEINKLNKIDYEGRVSPAENHMPINQKATWIQNSVNSIEIGFSYLSEKNEQESKKIFQTISELTKELGSESLPKETKEQQAIWEALHTQVKRLIDII